MVFIFTASLLSWVGIAYYSKTQAVANYGGEYIEGIIGQPVHINPILAPSNEVDSDLSQLVFNSLLKYDTNGNIAPDLAESWELSDDKTTYTFHLKRNVLWHDSQNFTASDVLFTVNLISDPAYKSPLRSNWQGIDTELVDDYTIIFKIKNPYVGFLNNLTFGILPKHIWESVPPENFNLAELNLEPIGTGPYKYSSFQKDSKGNILFYKLVSNPNYFEGKPYISKITFNFYADEDAVANAYNSKEILAVSNLPYQKASQMKVQKSSIIHKFNLPSYTSVFLNQTKSLALANDNARKALAYATNKQEIIDQALWGFGIPVNFPFLPGMIGYSENLEHKEFNLDKANEILDENDWKRGEDGIRANDGTVLEINLITTDWDQQEQVAQILKSQWERIGAKININALSITDIRQNYIRPREYQALLFGQSIGADPDPYSFWHSSNKKDPGLNLSLFGNSETDKLIDEGRTEFDSEKRAQSYIEFQKKLEEETPAIFLYSPLYVCAINKKVQGIEIQDLVSPSRRFTDINKWYIKTKRVWREK